MRPEPGPESVLAAPAGASRWMRPLMTLVAVGALGYGVAAFWSGSDAMFASLRAIGGALLAAGALLASTAYLFRFARWQFILASLGHRLPIGFSFRVYLAGLALTSSPGKLGETIRSVLLLPRGVPVRHSLAAFFADRLSDVIGVAALGAVAGALSGARQSLLEALTVIALIASIVAAAIVRGDAWQRWASRSASASRIARFMRTIASPAAAWASVWSAPRAVLYAAAAVCAYGVQAAVFGMYVAAVAPNIDLVASVTMFAVATLLGAASMIPAGLGAMEAALAVQVVDAGVPFPSALAIVVATRLSTLWLGILLGALMLLSLGVGRDRMQRASASAQR